MNNFKIEIYNIETKEWEDYSKRAVFPLITANLLDEQLDEVNLELKRVKKEIFLPNSVCRLTIINTPSAKFNKQYSGNSGSYATDKLLPRSNDFETALTSKVNEDGTITQTKSIYFLTANDQAIEKPIKSGLYDHKIYLIEITKIMEGFIGDSITFTNPLGNTLA